MSFPPPSVLFMAVSPAVGGAVKNATVAGSLAAMTAAVDIEMAPAMTITGSLAAMTAAVDMQDTEGRVTLTVDNTKVGSTLTDFPTKVDLSIITNDVFWARVDADGGNLRAFNDSLSELPIDVLWISRDGRAGEIMFKADSISSSSDTTFYIEPITGETMYSPSDTYGRNNVWSDYAVVLAHDYTTNRTGGGSISGTGRADNYTPGSPLGTVNAHQGVAWDGTDYFVLDTNAIKRFDTSFSLLDSNTDPIGDSGLSINHLGDGCIHDGELWVVGETYPSGPYANQHILVFDPADLSFSRSYDISAQGHEVSSITWSDLHGCFIVTAFEGTGSLTTLYRYSDTGSYLGTLTVDSIDQKQGIAYHDGFFYITGATGVVQMNAETGDIVQVLSAIASWSLIEGLTVKANGDIIVLNDGSPSALYKLTLRAGIGHDWLTITSTSHTRAVTVPKYTQWTVGASVSVFATPSFNCGVMSYGTNDGTDANRASLTYRLSTTKFGIWNSTDSWLEDPAATSYGTAYRLHQTFNGTTDRKIYRNGALAATDSGVSQRPASTGDRLFIGQEDTSGFEPLNGGLAYMYLRGSVLSADWLAAEQSSWITGDFLAAS